MIYSFTKPTQFVSDESNIYFIHQNQNQLYQPSMCAHTQNLTLVTFEIDRLCPGCKGSVEIPGLVQVLDGRKVSANDIGFASFILMKKLRCQDVWDAVVDREVCSY